MIPYILHATVILSVCLFFYKLLLQRETFYRLNRWLLMTCLGIAFTLPLLPIPPQFSLLSSKMTSTDPTPLVSPVINNPSGPTSAPTNQSFTSSAPYASAQTPVVQIPPAQTQHPAESVPTLDTETASSNPVAKTPAEPILPKILHALYLIWFSGMIVFGAGLLAQILVLVIRIYSRPVIKEGRFRIVHMEGEHAPCSFGHYIFINPARYDEPTYQQILLHEKAHAGGWHTLDILFAELGIVLQWFNPFAWMYRKVVENNLEFLADLAVLQNPGIERSEYQLSLLKVAVPHLPLSLTSNYNQSLLKRRIIMMNSQRSPLQKAWKSLLLLPVLVLLVCMLNRPGATAQSAVSTTTTTQHVNSNSKANQTSTSTPGKDGSIADPSNQSGAPMQAANGQFNQALTNGQLFQTSAIGQSIQASTNGQLMQTSTPGVFIQPPVAGATTQSTAVGIPVPVPVPLPAGIMPRDTTRPDKWEDRTEGSWFATTDKSGKICIEFKGSEGSHSWNHSTCMDRSEISGLTSVGKVELKIKRDAGTMILAGQFDGDQGFGHYHFEADPSYAAHLRERKIEPSDNDLVSFFFVNMKRGYVDMVQSNGYPDVSKNNLIAMSALHVDEEFIKGWRQAGYTGMSEDKLISTKALKIDKAWVEGIRNAGYDHVDIDKLISFKALGIDGDYIRGLKEAKGSLPSANDIISFKSLKIDAEYVAAMKKAGYGDVAFHDLISLRSLGVDAGYVESLNAVGYKNIPASDLISLKSLGITANYVKGVRDMGFTNIEPNELISFKSLGVDGDYIKTFKDIGFNNFKGQDLVSMKSMGITAAYVKSFQDIGYKEISVQNLQSLKAMGITPGFIRSFNDLGYKNIPLHQLSSLKAVGVNADYVKKMRDKGFVSDDLEKYMRLKTSFE